MPAERLPASPYFGGPHLPYFRASGQKKRFFQNLHFPYFWASGPLGNCRGRDLELDALIGIEFCEFRQKLKNLEFLQNSSFWESPGTIWIDFVSVEVVPSVFFFFLYFLGGLEILAGGSGADAVGFSMV